MLEHSHNLCFNLCVFTYLQNYRQIHPEVTVLDPPDAIQHLRNRQHMLQEVADMNFSDPCGNSTICLNNLFLLKGLAI